MTNKFAFSLAWTPFLFFNSISAPFSYNNLTSKKWALRTANIKGVFFSKWVCSFTFSPSFNKFIVKSKFPSLAACQRE